MKILVVTTSNARFGAEGHPTGVWLDEFTVPYMEFLAGGAEMTVASPQGGAMPIDPRTLPNEEQKIAWAPALAAAANTLPLSGIRSGGFDAIFLPGGHGPMFDLPENADLQRLLTEFHSAGKIIAAVCHGPCGLVNARRADGEFLVKGVTLTSYTYSEEVGAKLDKSVPFILEERLKERGANFIARENRANHVERDGQFVTGQNPFSSEAVAQAVMAALSHRFPPMLNLGPDEIAPVTTVAEFPAPSFIENIAISPDGAIYVSSLEEGVVYRVSAGSKPRAFSKLPVVAGLSWLEGEMDDTLIAGSNGSTAPGLYRLHEVAEPELVVSIPEAKLLNGLLHLEGSRYLVADSYASCIWEADIATGAAKIWLRHPYLAHAADPFHPVPQFPGVNGLKRFGDTLYASSTEQQKLVAIPLLPDLSAGEPRVFMTLINIDDFAFDVEGNLYGTTHIYNSVVRVTPDRRITTIAGLAQGMAGSTAVAFGRASGDRTGLYVTTNGGMSSPPPGGVQPGRVLRIEVGKEGA
jgi:putative intracellular protease/amidase